MNQEITKPVVKIKQAGNPIMMRWVLVITIGLMIAGMTSLVVFGVGEIQKIADETNLLARQAKASDDNIYRMQLLEKNYNAVSDIKPIIDKMVASQESYRYQDNAVDVLYRYASLSGIEISQVNFNVGKNTGLSATGAPSTLVSISLKNPISYLNFIKFMKLIEGGLSQMQILQVDVKNDKDNQISTGQMIIALYVK